MALSKGLRLLARLEATGESSVLLEARGRGDCLLFEAGTVATLGECRALALPPAGGDAGRTGACLRRDLGRPAPPCPKGPVLEGAGTARAGDRAEAGGF